MAGTTPANDSGIGDADGGGAGAPKRLTVSLLQPVTSLWAFCAKQACRASKKLASSSNSRIVRRSALTRPKQLLATISNKAIHFRNKKRIGEEFDDSRKQDKGFGDGGLWQRTILMGDKCQPLAFSGVIYYDIDGNRLSELPMRSPRASPLPSYLYPAAKPE